VIAIELDTSLDGEKISVSFAINVPPRCESLAALINCTFTRTALPLFCSFLPRYVRLGAVANIR